MTQDISFVAAPRSYILHNATDEVIELQYSGETRWVPPINVIAPERAARDVDGDYIPGTHQITDVYEVVPLGGETLMWSAANAVKHWFGIEGGKATSAFAKRGLSLIPPNPTKEVINKIVEAGRQRARLYLLDAARQEILAYDQLNLSRKAAGAAPMPPGIAYDKAVALLSAFADETKAASAKALGVAIPKSQPQEDVGLAMLESEFKALHDGSESEPEPPKKRGRPARA